MTKQTKHSEGPWLDKDGQEIFSSDGRLIAQCHAGHYEERRANARLIAAAPEMYEVIEEIAGMKIADCDAHDAANYMRDAARTLLSKMRGEA